MFSLYNRCRRSVVHVSALMYVLRSGFAASVSSTVRLPSLVFTAPVVKSSERKSIFMMKLASGCWWVSSAPACPSSAALSKRFCVVGFFPILAAFALLISLHRSCPFKDSHTRLFHAALTVAADRPESQKKTSPGTSPPIRLADKPNGARSEESAFLNGPARI